MIFAFYFFILIFMLISGDFALALWVTVYSPLLTFSDYEFSSDNALSEAFLLSLFFRHSILFGIFPFIQE